MSKLWLTLITQNRANDIEELTKDTYDYFDGIVAVDHFSTDGTYQILESRKKAGKITQLPFCKNHGWSMNGFLFSGIIKNFDWFMILDSSDRANLVWLKNIREDISYYNKNGIGGIFLDRIYLSRYISGMEFFGGCHWGLTQSSGKILDYSKINGYRKENYVINTRGKDRDSIERSGIKNPIKYFIEYPNYSQLQLLYGQFGKDILNFHTVQWIEFRIFCEQILKIELTVDSLVKYISDGIQNKNLPEFLIDYIELEVNMKDLVRYYILKQDFLGEIATNRFSWEFKKFYHQGVEHQSKDGGYVGVFNQYREQQGLPHE